MLFILGFKFRGETAGDGEIKPENLSTDLEHIHFEEDEFGLLGGRIFFFVNQNLLKQL
jgi:hypothetical protein